MKHFTLTAAMLAMIILLTGCGEAAGTGKTQGTTAEQSQLQTAEQSQPQTAEESQLHTAVLLTEKDYSDQEKKSLEILEGKLAKDSDRLVYSGNFIVNIYDDFSWKTEADIFPAKLDLRARGTVTPVKSQSTWASCWSFGAIASSETSILNTMGLTASEYESKYGVPMDLSEKHLAWFSKTALPDVSDDYPYDSAQAGEGSHTTEGTEMSRFDFGGTLALATSMLASGVGVVDESIAPYEDADGKHLSDGDWSLPEELRFVQSFELKNANVLPAPAYNAGGEYVYREAATEMIKSELQKGRAVGISYHAVTAPIRMDRDEIREEILPEYADKTDISDEDKIARFECRYGTKDPAELSDEEILHIAEVACALEDVEEGTYDLQALSREQLNLLVKSSALGMPIDEVEDYEASRKEIIDKGYLHQFETADGTPVTVQYTYDEDEWLNHVVTIVGWDDTIPVSWFTEGHEPPGPGAWIVKNSWGRHWGMDGFFYLSYYDRTLSLPQSFEFVKPEDEEPQELEILEHDFMPNELISCTLYSEPVYEAGIYEVETDSVLQYVSAMTGMLDTEVTAEIYLLCEGAKTPTDGELLETVSDTFKFAGYHRMTLPSGLLIPKGSIISIVALQRVPTEEGKKFAFVNTSSLGKKGTDKLEELYNAKAREYCVGCVNPGESFVSFVGGRWIDWSDEVSKLATLEGCSCIAYDNLPIKGYAYPLDEVEALHDFSRKVRTTEGEAAICPECGYVILNLSPAAH